MTVVTREFGDRLIDAMRACIPNQVKCSLCEEPLGDDRREVMYGPFPLCVHGQCRDLMMSYKLDRKGPRR